MSEILLTTNSDSVEDITALLPGGSTTITLPIPSIFPPLPEPPSLRTSPTSLSVRVKQTCPGFPACGRDKACVVEKASKVLDIGSLIDIPITLPGLSFPKIPPLSFEFKMPSLGFSNTCPNAQKAVKPTETAKQENYANKDSNPTG